MVEHRIVLDSESEYICFDHSMIGAYLVSVDDECRVLCRNVCQKIVSCLWS